MKNILVANETYIQTHIAMRLIVSPDNVKLYVMTTRKLLLVRCERTNDYVSEYNELHNARLQSAAE